MHEEARWDFGTKFMVVGVSKAFVSYSTLTTRMQISLDSLDTMHAV